jgi:hypothetical protein
MKMLLTLFLLGAVAPVLAQDVNVNGYTKKDGTRVESHRRTKADKTDRNNYSTKGNRNPYTGKRGTKRSRS